MIRPEDFYAEVNQNFRDISSKIDEYHKDNCTKIDKVAEDVNEMKIQLASHLSSSETAKELKKEGNEQKNHKVYWILGIVTVIQTAIVAAFELVRN